MGYVIAGQTISLDGYVADEPTEAPSRCIPTWPTSRAANT